MTRDTHTAPPRELATGDGVTEREIVSLLGLAASQIEVALREEEAPIATLGRSVTQLAAAAEALDAALATLPDGDARRAVEDKRDALLADARDATVALQFHDRLVQRLTHVRDSLAWLGEFVDRHGHRGPAAGWDGLRDRIRSQYSMQQERLMFDLLVRGATPDEVLHALADLRRGGAAGHVDLF